MELRHGVRHYHDTLLVSQQRVTVPCAFSGALRVAVQTRVRVFLKSLVLSCGPHVDSATDVFIMSPIAQRKENMFNRSTSSRVTLRVFCFISLLVFFVYFIFSLSLSLFPSFYPYPILPFSSSFPFFALLFLFSFSSPFLLHFSLSLHLPSPFPFLRFSVSLPLSFCFCSLFPSLSPSTPLLPWLYP